MQSFFLRHVIIIIISSSSPLFPVTLLAAQVPLICETKPAMNTTPVMNCRNNNGNFRPPTSGFKHELIPPDVARLMQLEEGVRPPPERKKPPVPPRHMKNKDHCTIDMNGLETNV